MHVSLHFFVDAILFSFAFLAGVHVRFGAEAHSWVGTYWPFIALMALVLSSTAYIFGLYSTHSFNKGMLQRGLALFYCLAVAIGLMIAVTYLNFVRPLGRGVTFLGAGFAYASILVHHAFLLRALRTGRERVLFIVTCAFDELETRLFPSLSSQHLELAGVVESPTYTASSNLRVLGKTNQLEAIVRRENVSRVLCTDHSLREPALCRQFCQLRYSGVTVTNLVNLCEEANQCVPLELITSEWLLHASGEPHLLYIKKIKRLFDIVASFLGLVLALPILVLAAAAIKLTSRGPIVYRQTRRGRFGRSFSILKLRSMRMDAEKDGIKWSSGKTDPRVTLVGRFLRKYRIDEIPQLLHVLVGEMSFVGPRPERPELVEQLANDIPFFKERLMVQPGITGWAQVNYPYGASVEDARRKLEFDLYYMKHMSLFLDLFILLDTVSTVLRGGLSAGHERDSSRYRAMGEWERSKAQEPTPPLPVETLGAASR